MSTFGSPGGQQSFSKPSPPQRGSFPLDHDGECTTQMKRYIACLKRAKGVNQEECRDMSRAYLECRMEKGLMARDEMRNLGFWGKEVDGAGAGAAVGMGTGKREGGDEGGKEGKGG